jgi:transcriptional regulator with XRE-family HTH domain
VAQLNPKTDAARGDTYGLVISDRIRRLRSYRGLTVDDLGRACQCSPSYLIAVEGGHLLPSLPMIYRLARALDVEPTALRDRTS